MIYLLCCFCMLGVVGVTNPPSGGVSGFGHGFLRLPATVGEKVFYWLIPMLALIPTALVAGPFWRVYRFLPRNASTTAWNFLFLVCGLLAAVFNASCYRGD